MRIHEVYEEMMVYASNCADLFCSAVRVRVRVADEVKLGLGWPMQSKLGLKRSILAASSL